MGGGNYRSGDEKVFNVKNSFDIDFRPSIRRSNGGLSGIAALLACRGSVGSPNITQEKTSSSASNQQVTTQGGGAGSETLSVGAGNTAPIVVQNTDPAVVQSAFQYGAEAQTIAGQTVGQSNATIQNIAGTLAALTANATPQTAAAASELAAGGTPLTGAAIPNNLVVIGTAVIVGVAATAYFVTRHR